MTNKGVVWRSLASGVGAAMAAGILEYFMTGGTSGWVPLVSGVAGAIIGTAIFVAVRPKTAVPNTSAPNTPAPNTPAPNTPAPNTPAPNVEDRILCPRTPQELVDMVAGKTDMECERISQRYVNTWLDISGKVEDVEDRLDLGLHVTIEPPHWPGINYSAYFSRKWMNRISILDIGDNISAVGQIDEINPRLIFLKNSEFKVPNPDN